MTSKKVIAICQCGGEFVKNRDGTLSYNGGEAYAIDIDEKTQLSFFKEEIAEMFHCDPDGMTIKYFLPGNKRTLISLSKDKDLNRMVSFAEDANTVDVFIIINEPHNQIVSNTPASRSSRTTASEALTPNNVTDDDDNDNDNDVVDDDDDVNADADADAVMEDNEDNKPVHIDTTKSVTVSSFATSSCSNKPQKHAQQWENAITGVDQRFGSFDELREALHKYSIAHGFSYRYRKNDNRRVTVKCKSEGCKWQLYASRLSTTELICIKTMSNEHTCGGNSFSFRPRTSRKWIASIIKEKLKTSQRYRTKDVTDDIQNEFGIKLNHTQAYRANKIAREQLQGVYREAYGQLPLLCERIREANPGSIVTLTTKEDSSFDRLFISFHASITGFKQGCRPLLFLDSAPLKTKYQGELLAAISADGDDGAFPISLAIVDPETPDKWRWFLEELKTALSLTEPVTFIADFQNGLKETLAEVFSNACHSYCLRYMAENLNKDFKGQFSHEARRLMVNDFYAAAYAPELEVFQRSMNNIKAISSEAYDWVTKTEPKNWANAFFERARYNLLTSNFSQLFCGWVSEVDELPITQMIEVLRGKMTELIDSRRMESNQWGTRLTPLKEEKLEKETLKAQTLQILRSHGCMFEVHGKSSHVVDIDNYGCSCKEWQLSGLPCCHAIAVFNSIDRSPYDYCSKYFIVDSYRSTYAESIQPVTNEGTSMEDEGTVIAPPTKCTPGRPKTKSAEPKDVTKRQLQCSKCKGFGHNKKTCKGS